GQLSKSSLSNLGKTAEETLKKYFFDVAFISCRSVSLKHGISDTNEQQAAIRKIAAEHANTTYLIADYTKFNKTSFVKIGDLDLVDGIIVDESLSDEWLQTLKEKNIEYIKC